MLPDIFITRTIDYRYRGRDLRFHLSHALFSSHNVDEGTSLLLKTLGGLPPMEDGSRILDVGSGTGVLGLALLKANPRCSLTATDRDELACAFTRKNAEENHLAERTEVVGCLDIEAVTGKFRLAVSNLPAKAGPPPLRHLVCALAEKLKPTGFAAIVIVNTLAQGLASELQDLEADLLLKESGPRHTVFHYRLGQIPVPGNDKPYVRREAVWELGSRRFKYRTMWGLEDFECLNSGRELLLKILLTVQENWISAGFWNMGQGQVPAVLALSRRVTGPMVLWDRDRLALAAAKENLSLFPNGILTVPCISWPGTLPEPDSSGLSLVAVFWEGEPQIRQERQAYVSISTLTAPGGFLAVSGPSSPVGRLLERTTGFSKVRDKKERGYRAVLLRRQN